VICIYILLAVNRQSGLVSGLAGAERGRQHAELVVGLVLLRRDERNERERERLYSSVSDQTETSG
jgi:hypothetical protein